MEWALFWQIVLLMGWGTVCYSVIQQPKTPKQNIKRDI